MMIKKMIKRLFPETHPLRLQYHRSKAFFAALWYGFPARHLTVIGITGTDGKTTTVGMVAHILNGCGIKTGALSTAFFQIGKDITWNATQKTSPSPFVVQKFLRDCVKKGCTHAVLECSSHGLLQGRMDYTFPSIAGITNISEEHLDYHGTMEEYIKAKSLLFEMLQKKSGTKVLHYDDLSYQTLSHIPSSNTIIYNAIAKDDDDRFGPPMHLWLEDAQVTQDGSAADVFWNSKSPPLLLKSSIDLKIPGVFNLENALCAIGCVKGTLNPPSLEKMMQSIQTFTGIPGRMEKIDAGQDFRVYIDFTVTPVSYRSTLKTLRSMLSENGRLLVLAGSCGDRMKEKRPLVGAILSELADISIITNEDPYTENPEKIIDDVLGGFSKDIPMFSEKNLDQIPSFLNNFFVRLSDRLQAIQLMISLAQKDDILLFAGKGSDTTMMLASGQIPWNEREIVREGLGDSY
jgi:UDP-N-acetylmuramoyl-L-alanyl-D-glutamate--2,6-diaminopimelate ligase